MPADTRVRRLPLRRWPVVGLLVGCLCTAALLPGAAGARTLAQMKGERRVLVIAAPDAHDKRLAAQRGELARWRRGAADRDVSPVELVGGAISGADDQAAALRRRLHLPASRFGVVLVGKDGNVALRSSAVVRAGDLAAAIDAMPMRRAGQR